MTTATNNASRPDDYAIDFSGLFASEQEERDASFEALRSAAARYAETGHKRDLETLERNVNRVQRYR